ncbi:RNA polymerase sigma-I factor [Cytobacillus sp. FSL K6-0129]|uniref:RNA polymerase sigma-I factor n=1 Tax=Cytobacillus sp. FSL K6-0129 TaxID=2921421 RepID=UPI0030FB90FA
MIKSLFRGLKTQHKTIEEEVFAIQNGDRQLRDVFIDKFKPFVAKSVSLVCRRFIYDSDDEFSVGLIAFNDAINNYNRAKGTSFVSFAEVVIKRRVIDYIRQQSKHQNLSLDASHHYEDGSNEQASALIESEISIRGYLEIQDQQARKEEIIKFTNDLSHFGISFKEIVKCSPKHADARRTAIEIAQLIANDVMLKDLLYSTKKLPIKHMESRIKVSRKTIERNRKYIIAMTLVLCNDFVYLKDYLKGVLET